MNIIIDRKSRGQEVNWSYWLTFQEGRQHTNIAIFLFSKKHIIYIFCELSTVALKMFLQFYYLN